MIRIEATNTEGIILVEPEGPLQQPDFEKLAAEIDAFTEEKADLRGLVIHTRKFPGWDDFNAFLQHMKFVRENHRKIQRIAIVTDSALGQIGPTLAGHFISAQIRHFPYEEVVDAKEWVRQAR